MDGRNSEVWKFANSREVRKATLFIDCYRKSGFLLYCKKVSETRYFVERKLFGRRMFTCELGKYGLL